jgi:hypothetical protein
MQAENVVKAIRPLVRWTCVPALVLAVCVSPVWAGFNPPPGTPEIDPGSIVSALALLGGAILLFTDRRR